MVNKLCGSDMRLAFMVVKFATWPFLANPAFSPQISQMAKARTLCTVLCGIVSDKALWGTDA